MRIKKTAAYLCTYLLLLMTAGCGNVDVDLDVPTVDIVDLNDENEANTEEENIQQSNSIQSQADDTQPQADLQLDGSIESIGNNSVTINKTFHPSANESVTYNEDKVLVTVYFSEETEFEIWTVKNGGVNGDTDTEKRKGAFSDLKPDANINMTGSYDGDDFYATHVIIYNFSN